MSEEKKIEQKIYANRDEKGVLTITKVVYNGVEVPFEQVEGGVLVHKATTPTPLKEEK